MPFAPGWMPKITQPFGVGKSGSTLLMVMQGASSLDMDFAQRPWPLGGVGQSDVGNGFLDGRGDDLDDSTESLLSMLGAAALTRVWAA